MRAAPADVVVCAGVGHALALTGRALHAAGARRVAVEDPSHTGTRAVLRDAGLEPVPAPVDDHGLVIDGAARGRRRARDPGPPVPDRRRARTPTGGRRSSPGRAATTP